MKVLVLTSGTNNTQPLYEPLRALGHTLRVVGYDKMPHAEHAHFASMADAFNPDWVLYIGAIEAHHGAPVPSVEVLASVGAKHPLVHLCCDGAEPYWWDQLERYYARGRFALQVNIDGVRTGPIGARGFTTLCPVDVTKWRNVPWNRRKTFCGFSGGLHGKDRAKNVIELSEGGHLTFKPRADHHEYELYKRFVEDCCVGFNSAWTGGNVGGMHVKFRAGGEIPAAGALVLENKGSPLADWFDDGKDFLTYETAPDAVAQLKWVKANMKAAREMAGAMRAKVARDHSPAVLWSQVMERLGFGPALVRPRSVRYRPWEHMAGVPRGAPPNLNGNGAPRLIDSHKSINLVAWNGRVWTVPQRIGQVNLDLQHTHPAIHDFANLETARASIK